MNRAKHVKWICPIEKRYHTKLLDMKRVFYRYYAGICADYTNKKTRPLLNPTYELPRSRATRYQRDLKSHFVLEGDTSFPLPN